MPLKLEVYAKTTIYVPEKCLYQHMLKWIFSKYVWHSAYVLHDFIMLDDARCSMEELNALFLFSFVWRTDIQWDGNGLLVVVTWPVGFSSWESEYL